MFNWLLGISEKIERLNWCNLLDEPEAPKAQEASAVFNGADCGHKHWRARGWNTIGTCTCVDCGAVLFVDDALNATVNRLEQLERRIDEKLRAL